MVDHDREAARLRNVDYFWTLLPKPHQRPGIDSLMDWLYTETDFFAAPASRKYHGAYPGGLLQHSLNVYRELACLLDRHGYTGNYYSAAIAALLHDVCKCNFYKQTDNGYTIEDALPMGHGEKSLYLVMKTGLELTEEEAAAIRWHMGAYGDPDKLQTLGQAYDKYPLALFLHLADMTAAHYIELED